MKVAFTAQTHRTHCPYIALMSASSIRRLQQLRRADLGNQSAWYRVVHHTYYLSRQWFGEGLHFGDLCAAVRSDLLGRHRMLHQVSDAS